MLLQRLRVVLPPVALVTILISSIVGAAIAIGVSSLVATPPKTAAPSGPPADAAFIAIGKAYLPQLGGAYAAAWAAGAAELDGGKSVSDALDVVSKNWSANRVGLYDRAITPELGKIVAESVKDADVTPAERAALAAAFRGLSQGLGQ